MARTITPPGLTEAHTADQDAADWEAAGAGYGTRVVRLRTERDKQLDEFAAIIDYLRTHPDLPLPYIREISLSAESLDEVEQVAEITGQPIDTTGGHPTVTVPFGEAAYRVFFVSAQQMAAHYAWSSYRGAVRPESESA